MCNKSFGCALVFLLISITVVNSQVKKKIREYEKTFQFSLFPGISTNGISSGSYYNQYSFNLFGDLSAGNRILEIGLLTNSNMKTTTGIQIGGLANIVGTNAFINLALAEERTLLNSEDYEVNKKGIQLAGILNYVLNHSSGIQLSGGLNVVGNDFKGVQLAGIGNSAGGSSVGLQLAGSYNISGESTGGFQISSFFNYTGGQLSGLQLGMINKASRIKGKKSTPPTQARGLQVGILNFSKEMDGVQLGLINFGGEARGKQIGLINFFDRNPSKEKVRMGTPIGLLNYGSKGSYFRLYYDDLFSTTIEYTTGNCLNCSWVIGSEMPYDDINQIYNQNALILGFDAFQNTWGFGYGFQKVLYNKFSIVPSRFNKRRIINYGIKFLHLNRSLSFDDSFNLLSRLNLDYGRRWHSPYFFVSLSLNYFILEEEEADEVYKIRSVKISTGKIGELKSELWPGYAFGIQF